MEGFLSTFPPFNVYGSGVCGPSAQGPNWGKREGLFMTPHGFNYLELCKSILSQIHPSLLPPLLKKANTKECGVQVNAKVDKIIQCSLGPKTLFDEHPTSSKFPNCPNALDQEGKVLFSTPPVSILRFLRPVSIYSPVFDRSLQVETLRDSSENDADDSQQEKAVEDGQEEDDDQKGHETTIDQSEGSKSKFIEQKYGYYHCKKCNVRWESAFVWCITGTSKVYYKQLCRKCKVPMNPYKVESIVCKGCSMKFCVCEKKHRHENKKPHRQNLCGRCKGKKLSCDGTFNGEHRLNFRV